MKVILAKSAGFCMGVRRAVEATLDVIQKEDTGVSTFGPLIHNPQVLNLLEERGVKILKDIPEKESGTVIIRAHGVPPVHKEQLKRAGATVKDATCPHVVKVQVIIKKYLKQGYGTVIIGDRNHAEVEGLMGFAGSLGRVVSNLEDVKSLDLRAPYIIVSQTTQDETTFAELSNLILERFPGGKIFNTICDATHKRQEEVRSLCNGVEAMVVVGGKNSANTKRLAEIAQGRGCPVFLVETEDELDLTALSAYECVGVTAGASTPTWMIGRVVRILEAMPGKGEGKLKQFGSKLLWLLLATNIYVGIAGGALTYTAGILQNIVPRPSHLLISFLYLFAMHNLNRFTDRKVQKFNDPLRALFYEKYRWPLLVISALSLAFALTLVFEHGLKPFLLLTGMSIFGIFYSVQVIPKSLIANIRVRGLKEIPGSKTFFVAVAWAFVTTLIPALSGAHKPDLMTLVVLFFVLLLVFVRNALFDVFEVQGDRIVGKETLPVCIGEQRTLFILHIIMAVLVVLLLLMPLLGFMSAAGFWLLPGILYIIWLTQMYCKGRISQGLRMEFYLETVFYLLAGLTWLPVFLNS
ncbi:MAG: 4-hydroxy-3-methylbut-2-enyl diphosphate reductase [Desulfobulbales bacterium]